MIRDLKVLPEKKELVNNSIKMFATVIVGTLLVSQIKIGFAQNVIDTLQELKSCVIVPQECPNANITFWLYTRNIKDDPYQLDMSRPEDIRRAPFLRDKPYKVIIHGYTGDRDYSPNKELRPAFFKKDDFNIISLDYGPIAQEPCYVSAVENLKVVANCTAQLIDYLVGIMGIPLERFHVIGFSLGGQTAGLIANYIRSGKFEHITGLDPALPLFLTASKDQKLDKSDGKFVDVIHTDAFVKGQFLETGHVDFYVNGGTFQPGCEKAEDYHGCNHVRSPQYYAESINSDVGFWGVNTLCRWTGGCDPQIMGYYTPFTARGEYRVQTNSKPPFAKGKPKK